MFAGSDLEAAVQGAAEPALMSAVEEHCLSHLPHPY